MKKLVFFIYVGMLLLTACGESAEEKTKREQAIADSIKTELLKADSLKKEQAKADSLKRMQTTYDSLIKVANNLFLNYSIEKENQYLNDAQETFEKALSYSLNEEMEGQVSLKLSQIEKIKSEQEKLKNEKEKKEKILSVERINPQNFLRLYDIKGTSEVRLTHSDRRTITGEVCNKSEYTTYSGIKCNAYFYNKNGTLIKVSDFTIEKNISPGECVRFKNLVYEPTLFASWDVRIVGVNYARN